MRHVAPRSRAAHRIRGGFSIVSLPLPCTLTRLLLLRRRSVGRLGRGPPYVQTMRACQPRPCRSPGNRRPRGPACAASHPRAARRFLPRQAWKNPLKRAPAAAAARPARRRPRPPPRAWRRSLRRPRGRPARRARPPHARPARVRWGRPRQRRLPPVRQQPVTGHYHCVHACILHASHTTRLPTYSDIRARSWNLCRESYKTQEPPWRWTTGARAALAVPGHKAERGSLSCGKRAWAAASASARGRVQPGGCLAKPAAGAQAACCVRWPRRARQVHARQRRPVPMASCSTCAARAPGRAPVARCAATQSAGPAGGG